MNISSSPCNEIKIELVVGITKKSQSSFPFRPIKFFELNEVLTSFQNPMVLKFTLLELYSHKELKYTRFLLLKLIEQTLYLNKTMNEKQRILIIGGGFFGLYLCWFLTQRGYKVLLFEAEPDFMTHASLHNQARVHQGYHYPRSVLTALRSRETFERFTIEFPESIYKDFDKYYLIGKYLGKVSSSQFYNFFKRIGCPITRADGKIFDIVNKNYISDCFLTKEYAFDALSLKKKLLDRLKSTDAELFLNHKAIKVERKCATKELLLSVSDAQGQVKEFSSNCIFNCTYSGLNLVTSASRLPVIPLKHELTEMALVKVPEEISHMGITVMCGPFFSVMPFPAVREIESGLPLHSFSHVRYTPHYEWYDRRGTTGYEHLTDRLNSAWKYMLKDGSRYIPVLEGCEYRRSLWEIKTVLPRSEVDDSRPILAKFNYGLEGFHCIMGGKIDNIYDAIEAIENYLER